MKIRTLVSILILVLAVLIIAGSCATRRKAIAEEDFFQAWSGTWINTDYGGGDTGQKIINRPDGTQEIYNMSTSTTVSHQHKYTITDMWIDSKGDIWYTSNWKDLFHGTTGNEMGKINDSGNTWEYLSAGEEHPIEEWEPDRFEYIYKIYYRQ
jgi:hypothetical protein